MRLTQSQFAGDLASGQSPQAALRSLAGELALLEKRLGEVETLVSVVAGRSAERR
jgi:hypothetical protein